MITFMKYFIYSIIFSTIFAIQIIDLTGNINNFSQMNANIHISKNDRMSGDNIIAISLIQYPANILFSEFFGQVKQSSFLFSSRIGIIDYGQLSNINENNFSASDGIIEMTIQNHKDNIKYGGSIGYAYSKIENYTSSLLIYNIGGSRAFFYNKLLIGISLENNIKIIKDYSDYENEYLPRKRLNLNYTLKYLPLNVIVDYLYSNKNSYLTLALKANLNDYLSFYGGKKLHFSENILDNQYKLLDNISMGLSFLTKKLQFNLGLQLGSASSINYGTSLIMIFK